MKKIRSFLYKFDLFGQPIKLLVKNDHVHNTVIGSFLSIGIIFLTMFSFLLMVKEMIEKQNPNIISNLEFTPNPENVVLSSDKYFFSVVITDQYTVPIVNKPNQTFFTIKAEHCIRTLENENKLNNLCYNYTLKSCNKIKLNPLIKNSLNITEYQLAVSYCIDDEEMKKRPIQLEGIGISRVYQRFRLMFAKCVNGTGDYVCANQNAIEAIMSRCYLGINFIDTLVNQKQQGNPFVKVNKLLMKSFSSNFFSNLMLYFRHMEVQKEENFLFYFPRQYQYKELTFEKMTDDTMFVNSKSSEFLTINIILDDKKIKYYLTYNNLFNIIGDISGLFQILSLITSFLVTPISTISLNMTILNNIFNFAQKQKKLKSQNSIFPQVKMKVIIVIIFYQQQDNFFVFKKALSQENQQKTIVQKNRQIKDYLKQKINRLQLKGFEKLSVFFCGYKRRQIQFGIKKIEQKLDVIYLIQKLNEIDKLKMLLLNEEQVKLFDYLPKPKIPIIGEEFKDTNSGLQWMFFQIEKDYIEKGQEALSAYAKIKQEMNKKNPISEKLIKYLDQDVKILFDCGEKQDEEQIQNLDVLSSIHQQHQNNSLDILSQSQIQKDGNS